jgi:hypothetical protein
MSFYCFRFTTRQQFRSLAAAEGLINNGDELITNSHTHALDEIGTIHEGGTYDPEMGEVITPPVALSGWHVNTIGLAPEAWDQYLVVVNSPARIFLGGAAQAPDTATLEAMA